MKRVVVFIKQYIFEVIGLCVFGILLFFFAISTRGEQYTAQFFDGIRTTSQRQDVVIVGVDDKSLQALGAWPWDRKIFADLTKKLDSYGVKAIVYDVLFLEPRSGDSFFKDELTHVQTKVIFAGKVDHSTYLSSFFVQPDNSFLFSAISNVNPDTDGKVRRYPSDVKQGGKCIFGLSEQVFRIVTFKTNSVCEEKRNTYFRYPIDVTTYSLVDILSDKIDITKLKDKVIFIGSMSLDLEDHFVGISGEKVPGVQVHSSIFTSLLNKEGDRNLSPIETAMIILLFMVCTVSLLHYVKTVLAQIFVIVSTALVVFLVSYLFFSYHSIIPAPWLLLSVLISGGYSTLIRFIKERKQNQYIQSLFSKYVHKDVLKELMKSSGSLNFKGEKRDVTVLFSDIRGFTSLSESLPPEELTTILNGYFSAMTPAILEEKGTIDKFIGDAIMAFWNAPLFVEDHQAHAVESALRMKEALLLFNKEHLTSLAAGIGIHFGDVIVGNVGSKERVNYTILGDTVNLASRVEGLTKKYGVEIIVTEEVKNKVDDKNIVFRKLDVITVKGKIKPTVLYEVMRTNALKLEIVKDYEIAFSHYQVGQFEKAKILFKALSERGDIPSSKMYERILTLKNSDNWDGVWHFDEK